MPLLLEKIIELTGLPREWLLQDMEELWVQVAKEKPELHFHDLQQIVSAYREQVDQEIHAHFLEKKSKKAFF